MRFGLNIQLFADGEETPKTFTQDELNGIVAKESKSAIEKVLKELGVEDVKGAKEGLAKLKELRDKDKTELERATERIKQLETENQTNLSKVLAREQQDTIYDALKSLEYDTSYAKTVFKLVDLSGVDLKDSDKVKEIVEKTIEAYLPNIAKQTEEFGTDKKDKQKPEPTNVYLEAFRKRTQKK